jgi:hypothetical protein
VQDGLGFEGALVGVGDCLLGTDYEIDDEAWEVEDPNQEDRDRL